MNQKHALIIISLILFVITSAANRIYFDHFYAYEITGISMMPNVQDGEELFVYRNYYKKNKPQYGDVVVTKIETEGEGTFLKRIIALPGDQVKTVNGTVYINNKLRTSTTEKSMNVYRETLPNNVSYNILNTTDTSNIDDFEITEIPKDFIFILGDNRKKSLDSRLTGLVEISNFLHKIVPKEHFVYNFKFLFF